VNPVTVVVVGAINVDLVVQAPRLPGPGETVVGERLERFGGGKGANAAVAAARAGAEVRLIGAVGDDDHGRAALAELRAEGVDVSGVAVLPGTTTGAALIVVDENGENQIAVAAGANARVDPQLAASAVSPGAAVRPGCALVSTEITPAAVVAAVRAARSAGITCVLNPAPAIAQIAEVLDAGPILTPNAGELVALAQALGASSNTEATAAALMQRTSAPVVVTLGSGGALLLRPDTDAQRIPARSARVVDTTGAGDAFNGVLAARLAAGDDLPTAVEAANEAAARSIEHVGARG
jgi:ribokinase